MTRQSDLDQAMRQWMALGPTAVRDAVIEAALDETRTTRQLGAGFAPWRYLTMATTPIDREGRSYTPVIVAAAALLLAAAIGAYLVMRPDVGVGGPQSTRIFTEADVQSLVDAPRALSAELVPAEIPAGFQFIQSDNRNDALHLVLGYVTVQESESAPISVEMKTGLESARTRFYDAVGPSGEATPVTTPGGSSFTVLAATYTDEQAAANAFDGFVAAFGFWNFDAAAESWAHDDEGAIFASSLLSGTHGRCFMLSPNDPCPQEVRVWRSNNMIVTVLQEGQGDVTADELVAVLDAEVD